VTVKPGLRRMDAKAELEVGEEVATERGTPAAMKGRSAVNASEANETGKGSTICRSWACLIPQGAIALVAGLAAGVYS